MYAVYNEFDPFAAAAPGGAGVRAGSLKAYGNAIVPQVAAAFIRAFMDDASETE